MQRSGTVLVAVLVVTALAALVAAGVMFRARAEVAASAAEVRGAQAGAAALSGIHFAMGVLRQYPHETETWQDNPDIFQNHEVARDGADTWYFTIYAANPDDEDRIRYGVVDEAAKLNVNTASEEMLGGLSALDDDRLDCLLDYRDPDAEARPGGAEQEYYDRLPRPYIIPNGPLATVEELFMVKGFTAEVVWGEDRNFNGRLDPNEDDGDQRLPPDNGDGRLDPGLRDMLTVHTAVPNVDSEGETRFNINRGPPPESVGLPEETRRFVEVYLAEGNRFTHPADLLEMRYRLKKAHRKYRDLRQGSEIASGVGPAELPAVVDRLTAAEGKRLRGLVNVNTARPEVLAALPGMDAGLARRVADVRTGLSPETKQTIAWLVTQNLLDADAFKEVAPHLTARSAQFSVRCVGFGVPCGRFRVLEAVVDLSGQSPRIAYLRDVTRLGLPFVLDPERLERRL